MIAPVLAATKDSTSHTEQVEFAPDSGDCAAQCENEGAHKSSTVKNVFMSGTMAKSCCRSRRSHSAAPSDGVARTQQALFDVKSTSINSVESEQAARAHFAE